MVSMTVHDHPNMYSIHNAQFGRRRYVTHVGAKNFLRLTNAIRITNVETLDEHALNLSFSFRVRNRFDILCSIKEEYHHYIS